jgi:hypothetical protein
MGPVFLHAQTCERVAVQASIPPMLTRRKANLIKGYGFDDRIAYGTGQVVASADLEQEALRILRQPNLAHLQVRSALNNCYACWIDRA